MKKLSLFLVAILSIFFLASCNFNEPLRNNMLDYYNKDNVYSELTGEIKSIKYKEGIDELFIEIELAEIKNDFSVNAVTGYGEFTIVNWSKYNFALEANDTIIFTSAPMYFYNGHILPIVALSKNEEIYISFNEGVSTYINWIQETFD